MGQASQAQAKVTADIRKVDQDESALNAALGLSSGGGGSGGTGGSGGGGTGGTGGTGGGSGPPKNTTTTTTAASASPSATAGSGGEGAGSTSGGEGATSTAKSQSATATKKATPQQLAVDQASIDTAQANVDDAQEALSGANLVSTIQGTVASVTIAPGDSVTAGSTSSSAQIVVIGNGSTYDVTTDVPVAKIGEVAIGQQAQVIPDSTNTELNGQVESIGVLASSDSTGTTYPVTISLDSSQLGQLSGADASVAIVLKKSVDVTTVPSSSVRTIGTIHLVTVVNGNTAKSVRVTLGTVGPLLTQVTSGVSPGDVVSLATLAEPLPSTSTLTTRFAGLGGGGLGGGGLSGGLGGGGLGGGAGFSRIAG